MRSLLAGIGIFTSVAAGTAEAFPPDNSLRPETRPDTMATVIDAVVSTSSEPSVQEIDASLRPVARAPRRGTDVVTEQAPASLPATHVGFVAWLDGFRTRATESGITQSNFDRAFRGIGLNATVRDRDSNQSEFTRTLWEYLDSAVSDLRVSNGQAALAQHRQTLGLIEQTYRVEANVVAAVWGLESAYGTFRGDTNIIEAMATLAYDGRRGAFFEAQLLAALRILQAGDVEPAQMTGSWAGAMGHTQFMPTSYLDHAVDITGDGRRDIWSDNPADALASTANYLRAFGWTYGEPWGMEVTLPSGFDFSQTGERFKRDVDHWNGQGVRLAGGGLVPDHGLSSILLPAGASGVALVIFDNFHVIERYNPADAYVIAVGHLSDRIDGGPAFHAGWPRGDRALSRDEREELQRRLTAAGFVTDGIDGIIGPNTIDAVRRYQAAQGLTPDGYASLRILQRLQ